MARNIAANVSSIWSEAYNAHSCCFDEHAYRTTVQHMHRNKEVQTYHLPWHFMQIPIKVTFSKS